MSEQREAKRVVVFVNKITNLKSADEALSRVEHGYETIGSERKQLYERLETERNLEKQDPEEQGRIVDRDIELTIEQKRLVVLRDQLHERKKNLIEAREAEINEYEPEDVSW